LHWHAHWSRVGLAEAVTIAAATGAYVTTLFVPAEDDADWTGPILIDTGARNFLRLGSRPEREAAAAVSDALIFGSVAHPVIIDNLIVTWLGRQSPEVAWQMFVINTQAYALTMSVNAVTKRIAARGRPYASECVDDPNYSANCDNEDRFRSFYSGHAAVTATGAGLLCAHHTQLELYGNPTLDTATCAFGVMMTAATGALRIASDNHWTSDVMLGHLMGYASGYLMPTLLYYHEFRIQPEPPHDAPRPQVASRAAFIPVVTDSSVQLKLIGMF
jgi:membrane-associated phospholipid phosphatase